jgi:hypothetical protein
MRNKSNPNSTDRKTIQEAVQKGVSSERERIAKISSIGTKFGLIKEAEQFVASGQSVREFEEHVLSKSPQELRNGVLDNPEVKAKEMQDAVARIKERRRSRWSA